MAQWLRVPRPATLDGVSVAFAFLAFRAVRRGKAPDRCYRVVWGAAGSSASINFSYEYGQSAHRRRDVSLLSVLGMVMFHEFLSQFEDGTDNRIRRENPKFGLRWLTSPSNTLLAAIAWRNHPPTEGTPGTVPAAVANLNRVREIKRAARTASRLCDAPRAHPARVPATAIAARPGPDSAPTDGDRPAARRPIGLRRRPPNGDDLDGGHIRVPTTASTVLAWAESWVRMSGDEELLSGPLTDDDLAHSRYGTSARHLRRLRKAVLSGALRQQAALLDVTLPPGFVNVPQIQTIGSSPESPGN